MKSFRLLLAILALIPLGVSAFASPGRPTGFINDFANVLRDDTEQSLSRELQMFEQTTTHEISVVTVPSLGGDDIESYANTLFREWGIGKKDTNNGLLFLIVPSERQMRIEVGYGLEGAVTDTETKHIQDDIVRPFFKSGDYDGGVSAGVKALERAAQEEVVTPSNQPAQSSRDVSGLIQLGFFAVFFGFSWLASLLGRSKSWWLGGVLGGIGGAILWFLMGWWYAIIIAALLGLVFDYAVSKNYRSGSPAWWAGGPWGGWDSWGGSGGGFGGFGGGSSGGGGSSSGW